jgi:hypothetical protein
MLSMKLLVIVAVQVRVLAPLGPDALHWLTVVGNPVSCEGGAVTVQVIVPPAPPEPLHWVTLWPPGPASPARLLPGGVATQVSVLTVPGLWHCWTVESIAAPTGKPVRLLVTVTVQVTVLAPPRPALLHWVTTVIGVEEVVVFPVGQTADPVHEMVVTIVAKPVGLSGVPGLYVKSLVIVIVQVIVSPPAEPVLLHWSTVPPVTAPASAAAVLVLKGPFVARVRVARVASVGSGTCVWVGTELPTV